MRKWHLRIWVEGVFLFTILIIVGFFFNFRTHTLSHAPLCESQQYVEYINCSKADKNNRYYLTGWPKKMYCYFDGKNYCSPWGDFLHIPRNSSRIQMWKDNIPYILLGSTNVSLLFISVQLSRKSNKNAHTRH